MKHRSNVFVAAMVIAVVSSPWVLAAEHSETAAQDELAEARAAMRAGREEIISDELSLTDAEEQAFRPIYDNYRADTNALFERKADLVVEYVARYRAASIDDRYADTLVDDFLGIEKALLDTRRKYVRRFRKALPARKVARLLQLENKIDAGINAELAAAIPLIEAQ